MEKLKELLATASQKVRDWFGKGILLSVDELIGNAVQPLVRTEDRALVGLATRIIQLGFIAPLVVVKNGTEYIIIDGHRRLKIAIALGLTEVSCIVMPKGTDPKQAFISMNAEQRKFAGREWGTVFALASDHVAILRHFPRKMRENIKALIGWLGLAETVALMSNGTSPSIATATANILGLQARFAGSLSTPSFDGRDIVNWLIAHKAQADVGAYLRTEIVGSNPLGAVATLFKRIEKGEHPYGKNIMKARAAKAAAKAAKQAAKTARAARRAANKVEREQTVA